MQRFRNLNTPVDPPVDPDIRFPRTTHPPAIFFNTSRCYTSSARPLRLFPNTFNDGIRCSMTPGPPSGTTVPQINPLKKSNERFLGGPFVPDVVWPAVETANRIGVKCVISCD